ncbi:unnamed protein product, partial [Gulo gulo]
WWVNRFLSLEFPSGSARPVLQQPLSAPGSSQAVDTLVKPHQARWTP